MNHGGSLVDPSFELLDPTPDIHALFMQFDGLFFGGALACCEVKWSPRMYTCAGICSYEIRGGRGGLCSIRLSKPLLTLRPRKDLVETLLHEMIHAFLFVKERNRDRDGHGPQFQAHMHRINAAGGTNITIYHSFHDEVRLFKQHWWRCTGPCKERRPFFGYVKRSSNRAPGKNDRWWSQHQATCGGHFEKKFPIPRPGSCSSSRLLSTTLKPSTSSVPEIIYLSDDDDDVPAEDNRYDSDDELELSLVLSPTTVICPSCNMEVIETEIHEHLDSCLA
uniref:Protein with SprT-like domain at the N terminus n=1 Tax=Caenorhabditis japonica TaxID=281687 RepID=A0A8R1DT24_CAEJA